MRRAWLAATTLMLSVVGTQAGATEHKDWYEWAKAFVGALTNGHAGDRGVIQAPADIDRQMVIEPRGSQATMRIIPPPDGGR